MSELTILRGADGDLVELYNKYEDGSPGLGAAFDRDFQKICRLLQENPKLGPKWQGGFRRLFLRHWNLGIFYDLSGGRILIHAIMDVRQDPNYVARRLGLRPRPE